MLFFWAVFLGISLFTYHPLDPSINQAVSSGYKVRNLAGPIGSYTAGLMVDLFGLGALLLPVLCLYLGMLCFFQRYSLPWWRGLGLFLLALTLTTWASHPWALENLGLARIRGGGFVGGSFFSWSRMLLRSVGATLLWSFLFLAGLQLTLGLSWASVGQSTRGGFLGFWYALVARLRSRKGYDVPSVAGTAPVGDTSFEQDIDRLFTVRGQKAGRPETSKTATKPGLPSRAGVSDKSPKSAVAPSSPGTRQKSDANLKPTMDGLPSTELLSGGGDERSGPDMALLEAKAKSLGACLDDFGVKGKVQRIIPGPVVTMFEFKPAPGVKLSRISNLSEDLALALRATAVRIEAVPGKDTIGIEIPNTDRETVFLREIMESDSFRKSRSKLTLALGKDIQGTPFVADLARMPHLLVAGATGAGKSVCLNSILLSLLYKAGPDEVKLLLVDPKRIELSVYASLPHLVHPVVTEMGMAKSALEWAVYEMEKRYEAMARLGVRNIDGYNAKLAKIDTSEKPDLADLEPMPYLVIVVDELADLMMTAGKEAEMSIVRLAQLARAAGVHLVIATQRPSVDVVTGLIKANFPSRISFQVTSRHDSRTILDTVGAEYLLGKGDMLYKPSGARLMRLHGAYVDEEEIHDVVEYWKSMQPQEFDLDFSSWQQDLRGDEEGSAGGLDDELYGEAVQFVMDQGKASISLIQRRFRIGFNRAARFIEQMEMDGLLGPQEGSKPRAVIKNRD